MQIFVQIHIMHIINIKISNKKDSQLSFIFVDILKLYKNDVSVQPPIKLVLVWSNTRKSENKRGVIICN